MSTSRGCVVGTTSLVLYSTRALSLHRRNVVVAMWPATSSLVVAMWSISNMWSTTTAKCEDNEQLAEVIRCKPPAISFTKPDVDRISLHLELEDRSYTYDFVLGQEKEFPKEDGSVTKVKFTEHAENILDQHIVMSNGRSAFFRRVFAEKDCQLIISLPETSIKATIYFEAID